MLIQFGNDSRNRAQQALHDGTSIVGHGAFTCGDGYLDWLQIHVALDCVPFLGHLVFVSRPVEELFLIAEERSPQQRLLVVETGGQERLEPLGTLIAHGSAQRHVGDALGVVHTIDVGGLVKVVRSHELACIAQQPALVVLLEFSQPLLVGFGLLMEVLQKPIVCVSGPVVGRLQFFQHALIRILRLPVDLLGPGNEDGSVVVIGAPQIRIRAGLDDPGNHFRIRRQPPVRLHRIELRARDLGAMKLGKCGVARLVLLAVLLDQLEHAVDHQRRLELVQTLFARNGFCRRAAMRDTALSSFCRGALGIRHAHHHQIGFRVRVAGQLFKHGMRLLV